MRVLITDKTHPILQQLLEEAGHTCTIHTDLTYDTLLACIADYDALVVRSKIPIDRRFLDQALHLRCIGRVGAGMETIDVDYAEQHGVRCLNSPEGNRDAVGEHATGLLLSLLDHIRRADAEVRRGLWQREANRGVELKGRTVGIIGYGNMGASFAQRLRGFECRIMAYDKYKHGFATSEVAECTLQELQAEADVVSLHVPLTDETYHMVDDAFFQALRKPVFLLNTSRGAVVDTPALVRAMEAQQVIGAGLDVIEYEDMSRDGLAAESMPPALAYLVQSDRTVLTPHVAGWTVESRYKLAAVLAQKMNQVLQSFAQ